MMPVVRSPAAAAGAQTMEDYRLMYRSRASRAIWLTVQPCALALARAFR